MKIALVYDRINKWGGAERVLLSLHSLFPDAPLFTSVYDNKSAGWADQFTIYTSFLQRLAFARKNHEYFPWVHPIAFETFKFDNYDIVISITSADAKGIITKPNTLHICYCLTPTRYLWSHYETYLNTTFMRAISKPIIKYLRAWDRVASSRPDKYIAISHEVKKRIDIYYKQNASIIYPPLSHSIMHTTAQKPIIKLPVKYILVVSRLVKYKCIDIAIGACSQISIPLVIVGSGREKNNLQKLANSNVTFISEVKDSELVWLYKNAHALIVPQEEDYGITMLESMFHGTPVIAYKKGGAEDIVIHKKTGLLVQHQSISVFVTALRQREHIFFDKKLLRYRATLFSENRFKNNFKNYVEKSYREHLAYLKKP